ncbi:alpha/beta hydrolase [Nonomuraea fuscirosea]|uniref:alpha/beta fold hydrolase n=1 Tax=Nonomuraea fuscirosea TaxID=1291556 RepID=UPI002DD88F4F|nr:alpha/beta hydrolase [Nonomuraea fuscirosea]WSA56858.1 alpha/beta hydrolase [Nonomuraea fuscirosea]
MNTAMPGLPANRLRRHGVVIPIAVIGMLTSLTPAVSAQAAPAPVTAIASETPSKTGLEPRIPAGFRERKVRAGDVAINYVRGGHGPTLVLLHGYPQTWYTWREVLPELAKHYTVIAPDLRGAGKSDAPAGGYDKKTLAADLHGLLTGLGLNRHIRLVGHDIGTMVAYAYAAAHPRDVAKLVLSEAPIPDKTLYDFPSLTAEGPGFWNFGFFSLTNGLPERMVNGREEQWVERFVDSLEVKKNGVSDKQVREYARHLRDDAHLRASFAWFRALPKDVADNRAYSRKKLTMPVLAIGARGSLGDAVPAQVRRYARDVTGIVIENSGHWIFEEQPGQLTRTLLRFLKKN